MLLGEVEFPEVVLDAQRDGRLVIFAGAGVSAPRPSSIPTFGGIVAIIESESGQTRRRPEPFDAFLGRVEASGYLVHRRVEQIIQAAGLENALHRAIIGLFPDSAKLRIVTTNYDRLLSRVANARWPGTPQDYVAPALPLGEDICGIVYLHGAIGQDPYSLVLTDADFGRAYLTQGHARRFLVQLFSNNVVLFVGYSHRDTVLTYLARGLPPKVEPRFALVQAGDVDRWEALSVEPIVYPTRTGRPRHITLAAALDEWGRDLAMGFGDHRRKTAAIVRRGPAPDPQALDYLRARIRDPDTVTFFADEADDLSWLHWIGDEPVFRAAMTQAPSGPASEVDRALAWWFADKFVSAHPSEARVAAARLGGRLSATAWQAIARSLWVARPSPDEFSAWLPVLLGSAPDEAGDLLDHLLGATRSGDDDFAAILLFDFLTDPIPVVERVTGAFTEDGHETARVEVRVRADRYELGENYRRVFRDRMDVFARPLLDVLTHHLHKAHSILATGGQANDSWDPASFRRSAIEPHEQDDRGLRDWWDVLVDAGRDAIDWAARNEPEMARSCIDRWRNSRAPLLRRLAVHAVGLAPWMDDDARLNWLVDEGMLFSTSGHHEVYRLIAGCFGKASDAARERLLAAIDEGSTEPRILDDPRLAVRVRYDLLQWLSQVLPADAQIRSRLERIAQADPEFQARAHPDLLHWMETGFVGGSNVPADAEDLQRQDPSSPEVLDRLLEVDVWAPGGDLEPLSGRESLLESVTSAATNDPTWGLALAFALHARREWSSDLWDSLAEAWGQTDLSDQQWAQVVNLLLDQEDRLRHAGPFARLLANIVRSNPPRLPAAVLPVAESLGRAMWNELSQSGRTGSTAEDWLERAVDEPAGQLAIFFIHALSEARSGGSEFWRESQTRETLESILRGDSYVDGLARAVLASQAHFFHSLDRGWTVDTLLPTFNWDADPSGAKQAWDGFLTWGRLTARLANDLLPMYESAFPHLARLGRLRERFAEHLSAIAFLAERGPVEDGWLLRFTRQAESSDMTSWARFVTDQLEPMSEDIRELAWNRWINSYWRRRIDGNPRPLSAGEAQAITEWPLELPSNFEQAVDNVCAVPPSGSDRGFYYRLKKSGLPERYPAAVARLTHHVLSGEARQGFWHCDDALDIARRAAAVGSVPRSEIQTLIDQLLRLHCRAPETILESRGDNVSK